MIKMNVLKKSLNMNLKLNKDTIIRKEEKTNTRNHNEILKKPLGKHLYNN